MTQGGFYQQKKMNPGAVAIVVLLHGAAIMAVALARDPGFIKHTFDRTRITDIKLEDPPPPKPQPPRPQPRQQEVITQTTPIFHYPDPPLPQPTPPVLTPPTVDSIPSVKVVVPEPTITPPPPPPPPPAKSQSARAKANLGSYVSDADYPSDAIRREEQGTTRFRLAVGPDGRVTDCTVTGSSGSAALDLATCRLMKSRARFAPARDSGGNAVADSVTNAINWRLPSG